MGIVSVAKKRELFRFIKQCHGIYFNSFLSSYKTKTFGGLSLDADPVNIDTNDCGKARTYCIPYGGNLRFLSGYHCIYVNYGVILFPHKPYDVSKDFCTLNPLNRFVAVREKNPDITFADGAKDSITNGMDENITV